MAIDQYNHFVAIVAGDNPEVLMSPYDKNIRTEPRVVYKYEDAGPLRERYIGLYKALIDVEHDLSSSCGRHTIRVKTIIQVLSDTNGDLIAVVRSGRRGASVAGSRGLGSGSSACAE